MRNLVAGGAPCANASELVAGPWDVDNVDYHADTECVSHSSLNVFRDSHELYYRQYVEVARLRPKPTGQMLLGSALHARMLGLLKWNDVVTVIDSRQTKAGRAKCLHALDTRRIAITAQEAEQVLEMEAGIQRNRLAVEVLAGSGWVEQAYRWPMNVQDGAVWCKSKPDRRLECGMILDLKTSSDPSEEGFSRSCHRYGYHRQASLYLAGARKCFGNLNWQFLHIVVGSEEPYECIVYELDEQAMLLGERQVQQSLRDLSHCRLTGDWTSPRSGQVNKISLPAWSFHADS